MSILQVLNAISELAIAGGADLVRSIDTLFGPLLQFLQDSSSLSRREVTFPSIVILKASIVNKTIV